MAKIMIDRARCEGYGFCEQAAPAVLKLDDEGDPQLQHEQVPNDELAAASAATRVCPVAALTLLTP